MRIQKYLSQERILSRREAEKNITAGNICVNGVVVTNLATQIDPEKDTVEVIKTLTKSTSLLYYKPRGVSSDKNDRDSKSLFDLHPEFRDLNTIGRLDKESEGAIILSNDGVLTNVITSDKHMVEKEYLVDVAEHITTTNINALTKGMILEDGPTLPTDAKKIDSHTFSIVLKEGRNHQIRRMADRVNLSVLRLFRIRIGSILIADMAPDTYRNLTEVEIQTLKSVR